MIRTFSSLVSLHDAVGEKIGTSEWLEITQERIDAFADVTGDHQWIHVDPERASDSPFGTTIAHGYLTLSLIPLLCSALYTIVTPGPRLNYGLNRVRFPRPVPVGSRVRLTATITSFREVPAGHELVMTYVIELEGGTAPVCVAEAVVVLLSP